LSNVIIQVAPFNHSGEHPFTASVTLLTMPTGTLLGYTESTKDGHLERDSEAVTSWRRGYDRLQVEALSRAASTALIRAVRKELLDEAR
jgi:hypothetical protein